MAKKKSPAAEAMAIAEREHRRAKSWTEFHNALFGIGGAIGKLFPTPSDRVSFVKTPEHAKIMELLGELQESGNAEALATANGAMSVRMPRSLHAALITEAEAEGVSLNQLCVSKLASQLRAVVH